MEYWSVECCANSELHPRSGLGILKKVLGSGFEMVRISQCESARVLLGRRNGSVLRFKRAGRQDWFDHF